jgi:hypothetical protein
MEAMRAAMAEAVAPLPVFVGPLPPRAGIALVAAGGPVESDLAGNYYARASFQVNSKGESHQEALNALAAALDAVRWLTASGETWQITGVSATRPPAYMGPDTMNFEIYAAGIQARMVFEGGS